ncbi:Hypothetical protein R9X50_00603600 [Acrodontium crateriforme]|uniref:Rhodopsin domain-containing protein n=1 Tax=Acrodontium crateriforme TaxID=150365 RepID=A0AAQ3M8B7_9PEZI|nr:Hypothetical protein R9X50_00603600 [Acrodontium crateriforme]
MPGNVGIINSAGWPAPNYVNPEHRAWLPAYAGTLFAVGTIFVATRVALRITKKAGSLGIDDIFLGIGWLGGLAFTISTIMVATKYDIGRHAWDVRRYNFENILRIVWIQEFSFLVCGGCTKIGVLLFFRRLVDGTYSRQWKYAVWSAIGFTAGYTLAFILALIFNCTPTEAYWKSFDPAYTTKYHCVDTTSINVLAGLAAAISDLYSVILPCAMTWTVRLPMRQKIALIGVFCLGLLVVCASVVRTIYLHKVGHESDITWVLFNVMVWSVLELQLALMCASAPAIRVLFRTYLNVSVSRAMRSTSSNRYQTDSAKWESSIPELSRVAPRRISDPDSRPNLYAGPLNRGTTSVDIRYSPPQRHLELFHMKEVGSKEIYSLSSVEMNDLRGR